MKLAGRATNNAGVGGVPLISGANEGSGLDKRSLKITRGRTRVNSVGERWRGCGMEKREGGERWLGEISVARAIHS